MLIFKEDATRFSIRFNSFWTNLTPVYARIIDASVIPSVCEHDLKIHMYRMLRDDHFVNEIINKKEKETFTIKKKKRKGLSLSIRVTITPVQAGVHVLVMQCP